MSTEPLEFERVRFDLTLKNLSSLHIGSGIDEVLPDNAGKKETSQSYAEICLDKHGCPYIPASTLRGFLSELMDDADDSRRSNIARALFGEKQGDDYLAGKVRVYDALFDHQSQCEEESPPIFFRTQVSMDPVTGTSKEHHLFSQKLVKPGSKFKLTIEIDKPNQNELVGIAHALSAINSSQTAQIGKGKSTLMGQIAFPEWTLCGLSEKQFICWLDSEGHQPLNDYYDDITQKIIKLAKSDEQKSDQDSRFHRLALTIHPASPVLVNDPHRVSNKSGEPDLEFTRVNNKLCIPASSLKGVMRAHCRKIMLTMLEIKPDIDFAIKEKRVDDLLTEIFGEKGQISLIRVGDALSADDAIDHDQTFIAIDRFTGGVADGALCYVRAAFAEQLPFSIFVEKRALQETWSLALLLMVLRDAFEGDIQLGWGKSKGYGTFSLTLLPPGQEKALTSWEECLTWMSKNNFGDKVQKSLSALESILGITSSTDEK